jgi:hypothetical protein
MCDTSSPHLITKKADHFHAITQKGSVVAPTLEAHVLSGFQEAQT